MLTAITSLTSPSRLIAPFADKSQAPFFCPFCKREVILKKGNINVHHFAHVTDSACDWDKGESPAHRKCKLEIYDALLKNPRVRNCAMERNLGTVRPDISCRIDDHPVAVEVQVSSLSVDKITHRTQEYQRKGVYVLWVSPLDEKSAMPVVAASPWRKWLHALNYGKIFYWRNLLSVDAYRYSPHKTWIEGKEWYIEGGGGQMDSSSGYEKTLKRTKRSELIGAFNIVEDFAPVYHKGYTAKGLYIPTARIWSLPFGKLQESSQNDVVQGNLSRLSR